MCGRFIYLTYDEVADVIKELEAHLTLNPEPDWPATHPMAYPKTRVSLIKPDIQNRLFPAMLKWGFQVEWQKGVIFNTRIESADKPVWRDSLAHRRCIVPAFSFFEPHKTELSLSPKTRKEMKRPYEFKMPDRSLFLLGAIWRGDFFSILTTKPCPSIASIHDRMPLVLRPFEVSTWLGPHYLDLADRSAITLTATPELPLYAPSA